MLPNTPKSSQTLSVCSRPHPRPRLIAHALALLLALTPAAAAQTARGIVYQDRNANQHRDAGEPGLPDVRVSNGVEVATTDADGRYTLPVADNTILFVVKPRDYDTARDPALKLARFYHHHRPAGTPDENFLFKGVSPTGPLPDSVDFPLYPRPENERFNVVLMGDPQVYNTQEVLWYGRDVAPRMHEEDAAFGIALGDLVGDNLDLFEPYNQGHSVSPFPWYNVLGNHDLNYMAPTDEDSDATFERVFGPSSYAFQYADVHFLILNNVYWPGFKGLRKDGWPRRGGYVGKLREPQMEFIANYLATVPQGEAIVICTHIPLVNKYHDGDGARTAEFPQLMELLSSHPHTLSFSGHTHINYNVLAGAESGYTPASGTKHLHHNVGTASGSWYNGVLDDRGMPVSTMSDGTPPGYAVASFDGTDYTIQYIPFRGGPEHQMLIHLPDVVEAARQGSEPVRVQANVFNATDESRVRVRVVGTESWLEMGAQRLTDPQFVANAAKREAEIAANPGADLRKLPKPSETEHHYVAELPVLSEGTHLIEVEHTDRYGRVTRDSRPLWVVASQEDWERLDDHNIRVPRAKPGVTGEDAAMKPPRPRPRNDKPQAAHPVSTRDSVAADSGGGGTSGGGVIPRTRGGLPEIVAHRGASYLAPENTLDAVELAWKLDADAVEIDVHLSRDGRIVLHHDKTTQRLGGRDVPVVEQTLEELLQLDVGMEKQGKWWPARVVTLERVLPTVPAGRRLFVEVKCGPEIVEPLTEMFAASGLDPEQLVVISFGHDVVQQFKAAAPQYRAYWLSSVKRDKETGQWMPTIEHLIQRARDANADGLDLKAAGPVLEPAWAEAIRAAGLGFYVWTVDEPADARTLTQLGVDGITTNRPEFLFEQLGGASDAGLKP